MSYVDGFIAAVPTANREAYLKLAQTGATVFRDCGALRVVDTWGDDVPDGTLTSFPMAVKKEANETVVFSWIEWPSKAVRDEGMKKAFTDPRMNMEEFRNCLDGKRMIFGGFSVLNDA